MAQLNLLPGAIRGDWKLLFIFYNNVDKNTVRAIPSEILRGAESKKYVDPPTIFFFRQPHIPHIFYFFMTSPPPPHIAIFPFRPPGSQME